MGKILDKLIFGFISILTAIIIGTLVALGLYGNMLRKIAPARARS